MLTVKQAAEILSVSPGLIYALCAQGKLEHERYGLGRGTIRIAESALIAFRAGAIRCRRFDGPRSQPVVSGSWTRSGCGRPGGSGASIRRLYRSLREVSQARSRVSTGIPTFRVGFCRLSVRSEGCSGGLLRNPEPPRAIPGNMAQSGGIAREIAKRLPNEQLIQLLTDSKL